MIKHEYNIFPEMTEEKFKILLSDISENGFDSSMPVYIYQNKILDGWNRFKACQKLNIHPEFVEFEGTDIEAIQFVMRTNKRRDLSSSQWACLAVEAEEIVSKIKEAARERMTSGNNQYSRPVQQIEQGKTDEIIADMFNTNRQYIREAEKLKTEKPEIFEQVKSGEKTLTKIKQEEKKQNEEKESIIPTGKPAEIDFTVELVSEMYDTINRRFSKLSNNEKRKAIDLLIKKLKEN